MQPEPMRPLKQHDLQLEKKKITRTEDSSLNSCHMSYLNEKKCNWSNSRRKRENTGFKTEGKKTDVVNIQEQWNQLNYYI